MPKFETKTARKERMRALIDAQAFDVAVSLETAAEINRLTGWNKQSFMRKKNLSWSNDTRCLFASEDGAVFEAKSWVKAIDGYDPRKNLAGALRKAVSKQIDNFMSTAAQRCSVCGSSDRLTADHVNPPFSKIAKDFETQHPGVYSFLTNSDDGSGWFLSNPLKQQWRDYHQARAVLGVLCGPHNSSKGARS